MKYASLLPFLLDLTLGCTHGSDTTPEPLPEPAPEPGNQAREQKGSAPEMATSSSRAVPAQDTLAGGLGFNEALRSMPGVANRERLDEAIIRKEVALAREQGVRYLRLHSFSDAGFSQLAMETCEWDFARRDDQVRYIQEGGLEPIIMLGPWPGNKTSNYTDDYLPDEAAYRAYVQRIVERYDGDGIDDMPGLLRPVTMFEADNEPDIHHKGAVMESLGKGASKAKAKAKAQNAERSKSKFKGGRAGKAGKAGRAGDRVRPPRGTPPERGRPNQDANVPSPDDTSFQHPREYATLYVWTAEAAKEASPDATILPAGLFTIKSSFGRQYIAKLFEDPKFSAMVPVANVHIYLDNYAEVKLHRAIAHIRQTTDKPIWITETSVPSGVQGEGDGLGQRGQASMTARILFTAMANGVEAVFWHALYDVPAIYNGRYSNMARSNSLYTPRREDYSQDPDLHATEMGLYPKLAAHTFSRVAEIFATIPTGNMSAITAPENAYAVAWTTTDGKPGYAGWAITNQPITMTFTAPRGAATATVTKLVPDNEEFSVDAPRFSTEQVPVKDGQVSVTLRKEPVSIQF